MEKDDRFKHIANDPKFRRIPKSERKVKIDKRFQSMFKDEKFKLKYTIDKRGRPFNHTTNEDLKRYYELSDEDSDDSEHKSDESEDESKSANEQEADKFVKDKSELNKKIKDDNLIPDNVKSKLKDLKIDYARGEGNLLSDSSSDDESEIAEEDEEIDHGWGELDKDAEKTDEVTNTLAACNLDWDRIRAVDLMVLFNSFIPSSGLIQSVTIYPSDFGLQRMKEEEITGPKELVKNSKNSEEYVNEEETEEGSKYHMEKLRQYQLNRLKYYYAVVVCDTKETANKIYEECDGLEYESSATKLDLRFVPNGTEFENEPKEVCRKLPEKYQPRFFTTTALQQAKVELTWDETNPERLEITKKLNEGKIEDVSEADLQAYLASSSGEESEEDEDKKNNEENSDSDEDSKNPIDKYRALLQDIENSETKKKDKEVDLEITWGLNLKEKSEKLVKKKIAENEEKTPFQQYLNKRKEKRKAKREERKKKREENGEEEGSSDDQSSDDIPSDIDMNDPYFAEEFDKPEFKSKKKDKKKTINDNLNEETEQEKAELELLLLDEKEDNKKHFSLKKIQEQENESSKKKKKKKGKQNKEEYKNEDNFQLDIKDDRFSALYSSHHFNIDPTDPHYKKTKAMDALIEEKLKRRADNSNESLNAAKKSKVDKPEKKKNAELNALVKSVKRKTQAMLDKK